MKTYAIGDMHGRFDLLCKAIDMIEADSPEGGHLVCMGDFVDRGPNSRGIIDLFMAGPTSDKWKWIVLQGNHEAMMLEALSNPEPGLLKWWFGNGGTATLASYGYRNGDKILPLKVPKEHLDWLANLPVWHEDENRIYVHAAVPHDQSVETVKKEVLQWSLHEGDMEGAPGIPDVPHMSGKHIVHGHHQDMMHPLIKDHRTNMDSFAWYSGRLAIGVFDDTQQKPIKIMDAIARPDPRFSNYSWSK
jgi:serine/threonine protein phosphatase 1